MTTLFYASSLMTVLILVVGLLLIMSYLIYAGRNTDNRYKPTSRDFIFAALVGWIALFNIYRFVMETPGYLKWIGWTL
jgi:hypothetical protein